MGIEWIGKLAYKMCNIVLDKLLKRCLIFQIFIAQILQTQREPRTLNKTTMSISKVSITAVMSHLRGGIRVWVGLWVLTLTTQSLSHQPLHRTLLETPMQCMDGLILQMGVGQGFSWTQLVGCWAAMMGTSTSSEIFPVREVLVQNHLWPDHQNHTGGRGVHALFTWCVVLTKFEWDKKSDYGSLWSGRVCDQAAIVLTEDLDLGCFCAKTQ